MSSTNRGYDRHKADYYVTPQAPIFDFLKIFLEDECLNHYNQFSVLDPCAGGSCNDEMSYPAVINRDFSSAGMYVQTIDIRDDSKAEIIKDYLQSSDCSSEFDIIITNPPFSIALSIIQKALTQVKMGGYVVMLLRLNFFGSEERYNWFVNNMPKYCYVHHKRMSFIPTWLRQKIKEETGKAPGTDSIEYAHFVWQKGYDKDYTTLKLI